MCYTNVSSLCKWFVVFISVIAGIVFPFVLNTLGIAVTVTLPAILLGLSVLLLAAGLYLALRAYRCGGDFAGCFCTIGNFLIVTAVISILLAFVAIAIISSAIILVFTGVLVAFSTAALLSLVCFILCLVRTICGCSLQ